MENLEIEHPTVGELIDFYRLVEMSSKISIDGIPENMYDISTLKLKASGQIDTLVFSFKKKGTIIAMMEGHMYMKRDEPMIYLRHLVVHPDYRRNGYGSQAFILFVKSFINGIKAMIPQDLWNLHMPKYIELIVETKEPVKFWKGLGFYEIPTIEGDKDSEKRFRLDFDYNESK